MFRGINIENGSVGTQLTRLWKREVGMAIISNLGTLWDMTPIVGMNRVLSIEHIRLNRNTLEVVVTDKPLEEGMVRKDYIQLLVYKKYVPEILAWIEGWKGKQ